MGQPFGLGRGLTYRDATAVDRIVRDTQADGGGMRTLLKNILHSVPMTHLSIEPAAPQPDAELAQAASR